MSDNIVGLHSGIVTSDRKQQFLDHIADSYDRYTADNGEPEAFVMIWGGFGQRVKASWLTTGASEGNAGTVLARALAMLTVNIREPHVEMAP